MELTQLTQGRPIVVERVRLADKDIAIEGSFELPQLARLGMDDQVFITAFVRSHGSIKQMERIFGVSYPTLDSVVSDLVAAVAARTPALPVHFHGMPFLPGKPFPRGGRDVADLQRTHRHQT